ncbi:MAG: NADPH2:quinone reductase [Gammaproteobacteria bacterium]|jgi:NADPH2:quinone reductase
MNAVLCKEYCTPSELVVENRPPPSAGPGQVLVTMQAAGVNFADSLIIQGKYQFKPEFPFSPGLEGAGVIRELGPQVSQFKEGDRVMVHPMAAGAFAEELVSDAITTWKIPSQLDFATAAGFCVSHGTSYHALKDRAQLVSGETLLVLGAAGGVGLAAVELGKVMGANVIAAASTPEKLALCKRYGADETINYTSEDLRARVKEITGGQGVDVVYDPVGGESGVAAFRSLRPGGRFLVVGFAGGEVPAIPINLVLIKRSNLLGVFLGNWILAHEAAARSTMQELCTFAIEGRIRPHISARYPLERAGEAIDHVAQRKVEGKVVIDIG